MRKRFTSLLLCICMIATLCPAMVFAGTNTNPPGLYWRWPLEEKDSTGEFYFVPNEAEDPVNEDIVGFGFGTQDREFFYCDDAGNFTTLNFSDLEFSGDCIEPFERQEGFVAIRYRGLGTGSVSYETGGQIYTLPIRSELPDIGFYSSPNASEETYLTKWTVTEDNDTVYFVARGNAVLTNVEEISSNHAVITLAPDGKYAEIQVTDPQEDELGVRFTSTSSNGTWWLDLIRPVAEGLYWRWPDTDWNNGQPVLSSDPDERLRSNMISSPYGTSFRELVYVDADGQENHVNYDAVSVSGDFFRIEPIQNDFIELICSDFGTGTINYNGYSVRVECVLPEVGFYDAPIASQQHFLKEWNYDGSGSPVYLVAQTGYTIANIEFQNGSPFTATLSADSQYATITLTELTNDAFIEPLFDILEDGQLYSHEGIFFRISTPGFYWRWPDTTWNNGQPTITSNPDAWLESRITAYPRGDSFREFVFKDADGTLTNVKCSELTTSGDFFDIESIQDDFVVLTCHDFGTGSINYNGYSIPVESVLPEVGFYDEPSASQTHFLREWNYDGNNNTIYLVAENGYTIRAITGQYGSQYNITLEPSGTFATIELLRVTNDPFIEPHYIIEDPYGESWEDSCYINIISSYVDSPLTRRDVAKIIADLMGVPFETSMADSYSFADVPIGSDGYDEIILSCYLHILAGFSDTEFGPDVVMSRAQLATVLCRMTEVNTESINYGPVPTDVSSDSWYYSYVLGALKYSFMSPDASGYFNPDADAYTSDINMTAVQNVLSGDSPFTFDASTGTISGYAGGDSTVTIPSEIDGVPVTRIAHLGMQDAIKKIVIPSSVTEIETNAFGLCGNLESFQVDSQNPVFSAKDGVLFSKDGKTLIRFPRAKSSSYTIPYGVSRIADHAFHDALGLTTVVITAGVITIDSDAFNSCNALNKVTLPNSLQVVAEGAFTNCGSQCDVYYIGDETTWNNISIENDNDNLLNATIHFIEPPQLGDADNNGEVGTPDRVLLSRYLAGWKGAAEDITDISAMDINKDAKVNAKDRLIMSRYIAGWGEEYNAFFE